MGKNHKEFCGAVEIKLGYRSKDGFIDFEHFGYYDRIEDAITDLQRIIKHKEKEEEA